MLFARLFILLVHVLSTLLGAVDGLRRSFQKVTLEASVSCLAQHQQDFLDRVRSTYSEPQITTDTYSWTEDSWDHLVLTVESHKQKGPYSICFVSELTMPPLDQLLDETTDTLALVPGLRAEVKSAIKPLIKHKLKHPQYLQRG